ncbi:MAG: cytochrome c biogenesis protein DipZ [Acidobacteriia bacterium]|nr:cytochrome c biogenesis protein DipZ [Terriglobia bacterium]
MGMLALAFLGGILTIISPCILPVLPFVFARADQPFRKSSLPLLAGMALTFAIVAAAATAGGAWVVRANQYGRIIALAGVALFGLTLVWPGLAELLSRPLVRLGAGLTQSNSADSGGGVGRSLLLGIGTGLLWAPCAGPILGLVLTGAALGGAGTRTVLLLVAYAAGASVSLAVALLAGGRLLAALKRSLKAESWVRAALGIAVLAGVGAIALGLDRGILTKVSLTSTSELEQSLVDRVRPPAKPENSGAMMMMSSTSASKGSGPETMPELAADGWLNSPPLDRNALRGRVVLIDFWTYSCINCLRTLPYIQAWADKYKASGFLVIGVHTPEFPFEKDLANVRRAVSDLHITYPVAIDNGYRIWKSFHNSYWPADYLIDGMGHIRYHHFGEGKYDESERQIQALLKEKGGPAASGFVEVRGSGAEAPPDNDVESPETYVGYDRADSFIPNGGLQQDRAHVYSIPTHLELNQWGLGGTWTDRAQSARLDSARGRIAFRFHARDVHLVLGPPPEGKTIRFRVTLDGKAPGANHGVDTDAEGNGQITEHRLYQLIRQKDTIEDRTFEIEFRDAGAEAFAFTFG